MKVAEFCGILNVIESVNFQLPNGDLVPTRFHVTEVGLIQKLFVDNGIKVILIQTYTNIGGTQKWYQNGKLHRDNDLPAIVLFDGSQSWSQNGKLHRDGGPAVEYANGDKFWSIDGKKFEEGSF